MPSIILRNNRVGGKRSRFLPTFVFRPLTPPYVRFRIRRFLSWCAISLDNSWCITVEHRMHTTCCASAYQLICKRTTAVVRPEILTNSKTYTILSNNLYYVFQQHISNIPTNKKGESFTYDTPSLLKPEHN